MVGGLVPVADAVDRADVEAVGAVLGGAVIAAPEVQGAKSASPIRHSKWIPSSAGESNEKLTVASFVGES